MFENQSSRQNVIVPAHDRRWWLLLSLFFIIWLVGTYLCGNGWVCTYGPNGHLMSWVCGLCHVSAPYWSNTTSEILAYLGQPWCSKRVGVPWGEPTIAAEVFPNKAWMYPSDQRSFWCHVPAPELYHACTTHTSLPPRKLGLGSKVFRSDICPYEVLIS